MTVIVVEKAPPSLRGELTRWMLEVKAGVYVGKLTARLREKLWTKVCFRNLGGFSVMATAASNEQGFELKMSGMGDRSLRDFDGLLLVTRR